MTIEKLPLACPACRAPALANVTIENGVIVSAVVPERECDHVAAIEAVCEDDDAIADALVDRALVRLQMAAR